MSYDFSPTGKSEPSIHKDVVYELEQRAVPEEAKGVLRIFTFTLNCGEVAVTDPQVLSVTAHEYLLHQYSADRVVGSYD